MPIRPFNSRARPDPAGNVVPYDTPSTAEVLELTGDGDGLAWPCRVTNEVEVELIPFRIGGTRTLPGHAAPYPEPEALFGENPRRGAVTLWVTGEVGGTWRLAGTLDEARRDDSSVILYTNGIIGTAQVTPRLSWSGPLWVQQRSGGAATLLSAISEDWAR